MSSRKPVRHVIRDHAWQVRLEGPFSTFLVSADLPGIRFMIVELQRHHPVEPLGPEKGFTHRDTFPFGIVYDDTAHIWHRIGVVGGRVTRG